MQQQGLNPGQAGGGMFDLLGDLNPAGVQPLALEEERARVLVEEAEGRLEVPPPGARLVLSGLGLV